VLKIMKENDLRLEAPLQITVRAIVSLVDPDHGRDG